jgi:hypothetical protein
LSLDAYRDSYANAIQSFNADENEVRLFQVADNLHGDNSDDDDSNNNDNNHDNKIILSHAVRVSERPKKRRIRSGVESPFGEKRQKKCSRCDGFGHAITTCDKAI